MKKFDDGTDFEDFSNKVMNVLVTYSRVILIAVYTHLLTIDNTGWMFWWRWVNVGGFLLLYSVELFLGARDDTFDENSLLKGLKLKME